jgi:hypothetical protein
MLAVCRTLREQIVIGGNRRVIGPRKLGDHESAVHNQTERNVGDGEGLAHKIAPVACHMSVEQTDRVDDPFSPSPRTRGESTAVP